MTEIQSIPINTFRQKESWGKYLWAFIHTITVIDFINNEYYVNMTIDKLSHVQYIIPCKHCAEEYCHSIESLANSKEYDVYKSMELFRWSVDFHNQINKKLGKPEFMYEDALLLWAKA